MMGAALPSSPCSLLSTTVLTVAVTSRDGGCRSRHRASVVAAAIVLADPILAWLNVSTRSAGVSTAGRGFRDGQVAITD